MSAIFDIDKFDAVEQKKIDKLLTFTPTSKNFGANRYSAQKAEIVKMYFCKDKVLHLPFRFACGYFNEIFNQEKEYPKIFEKKKGNFTGKLLDRQKEPFKEAVGYLAEYRSVTIALYPGFGKTFMGVMLSWYINLKTCVLVHRDSVGKQWVKTFINYFKIDEKEICWVPEGEKKFNKDAKVFVCMSGRTDKIPSDIRKEIGTLIIDEAHCFCSISKVNPMLSFSPKYVIAETATPIKENGMHKMIQSICGEHFIWKTSTKPYHFFLIDTNLPIQTTPGAGNIFGELLNLQCINEERNKLIVDILDANKKYKTIIATSRKEHCKDLKSMSEERGMETSELYGSKKNYDPKNILIGTCSKMGVGFDEANFCDDFDGRPSDLLIICQTFASWAPFEQVRGRGMRTEKPTVIMFKDNHHITKRHFQGIKRWVKETNGVLIELKADKMETFDLENYK
jgi:superfamily II DNA or RNA helicase